MIDGKDNRMERAIKHFDDEKVKKLLQQANSNKHQDIWHKQQSELRKREEFERKEALRKRCDANYFYKLFKYTATECLSLENKSLKLEKNQMNYLKAICFFFSGDSRFETELGMSLQKGLWVRGGVGRGKSFVLQCLQENDLFPYNIHSMVSVSEKVADEGYYEILSEKIVLDDVGTEECEVKHYGTRINWFKNFIETWYAAQRPFNRIIVTTNLDFNGVEDAYGIRVRSRIKSMFNVIDVRGEDLRN